MWIMKYLCTWYNVHNKLLLRLQFWIYHVLWPKIKEIVSVKIYLFHCVHCPSWVVYTYIILHVDSNICVFHVHMKHILLQQAYTKKWIISHWYVMLLTVFSISFSKCKSLLKFTSISFSKCKSLRSCPVL